LREGYLCHNSQNLGNKFHLTLNVSFNSLKLLFSAHIRRLKLPLTTFPCLECQKSLSAHNYSRLNVVSQEISLFFLQIIQAINRLLVIRFKLLTRSPCFLQIIQAIICFFLRKCLIKKHSCEILGSMSEKAMVVLASAAPSHASPTGQ
jgi:hypothetical protein